MFIIFGLNPAIGLSRYKDLKSRLSTALAVGAPFFRNRDFTSEGSLKRKGGYLPQRGSRNGLELLEGGGGLKDQRGALEGLRGEIEGLFEWNSMYRGTRENAQQGGATGGWGSSLYPIPLTPCPFILSLCRGSGLKL